MSFVRLRNMTHSEGDTLAVLEAAAAPQERISPGMFAWVALYGIGAWVTINGLFSELPLIVNDLPEGWAAASYLTLVIQIANIGPLVYVLLQRRVSLFSANVAVLLIGVVSMVLLSFLWDSTAHVAGARHSVALIVLSFTASLADCTTSLLFWPFVARFPARYAVALSTGEGISGLLAAALTWIQNAPSDGLLFSPAVYFVLLAAMLLASLVAFLVLHRRQPDSAQPGYAAVMADEPKLVERTSDVHNGGTDTNASRATAERSMQVGCAADSDGDSVHRALLSPASPSIM